MLNVPVPLPRGTRPLDLIIELRSAPVGGLENMFKYGNPWGRSRAKGADWANGLSLKTARDTGGAASSSSHVARPPTRRARAATRAHARLLMKAGVDFVILEPYTIAIGKLKEGE